MSVDPRYVASPKPLGVRHGALSLFLCVGLPLGLSLAVNARAADTPPVVDVQRAGDYVGRRVTVEGEVVQVSETRSETTYLNFVEPFPKSPFSAVIFKKARPRFQDTKGLQGRRVRVTGEVRLYRGRPEMIVDYPEQVEVVK